MNWLKGFINWIGESKLSYLLGIVIVSFAPAFIMRIITK